MTLPANVPNVPTWQMCRVRWNIGDFGGQPVAVKAIEFTASVPYVIVAGIPRTLVKVFPSAQFINGILCDTDGNPYIDIVASEDPDISPNGWTITATATVTDIGKQRGQLISVTFTTPVDGSIDLSTRLTVPSSNGQAITRGLPGVGIETITATGTTATVTYDDGTTSTFELPVGTGGGGDGGLTADPDNAGYYLIGSGSSLTPDSANPGYYLIGA